MTAPELILEIAFATDPGDPPVWVQLPRRVLGFSLARGRNSELDQFQAGGLGLTLDNDDRALDPAYAAGPYYGDILPMRRVRLSAIWDSVTYPIFTGFAEGFPQLWPRRTDAVVELAAVDGFKVLALSKLTGVFGVERSDERIAAALDEVGWPAADRDLAVGQSDVQASVLSDEPALGHIQLVEATEQGRFYIAVNGDARFLDRHGVILDAADGPAALFGVDGFDCYDPSVSFDDANIWNQITVERSGAGTPQFDDDPTSVARYYGRPLTRDTLLTTDLEAADAVQGLLLRYAEPHLHIGSIGLLPDGDAALWPIVLGLDLGALVTVALQPPAGGDLIEQTSVIEAIRHDWSSGGLWATTYQLSGLEGQSFWLLGIPGASELSESTVLGY